MKINICFFLSTGAQSSIRRSFFPVMITWIDIYIAYYLSNNAYYKKQLFISNKMFLWGLI
jgi:hypothetical protein